MAFKKPMSAYVPATIQKEFTFKLPVKIKAVDSYEEATAIYQAYRDIKDLGASKLAPLILLNKSGEPVAHVSYNGRVWQSGDLLNPTPEIHVDQTTVQAFYEYYKTKLSA